MHGFCHCVCCACYVADHLSIVIHVAIASHLTNVISRLLLHICANILFLYSFLKCKVRRKTINGTLMFLSVDTSSRQYMNKFYSDVAIIHTIEVINMCYNLHLHVISITQRIINYQPIAYSEVTLTRVDFFLNDSSVLLNTAVQSCHSLVRTHPQLRANLPNQSFVVRYQQHTALVHTHVR